MTQTNNAPTKPDSKDQLRQELLRLILKSEAERRQLDKDKT